jgi:hypothetical protein
MQTEIRLGRCYELAWTTRTSAFAGTAALWAILAIATAALLKMTWAAAIALGLAAALLHWLSDAWHQKNVSGLACCTLRVSARRRPRLQRQTRNVQRSTRNVHAPNKTWP